MDLLSKVLYVSMSSDMYLYPDLDTWTVFPWGDENGSVAGLICDVYTTEGEPLQETLVVTRFYSNPILVKTLTISRRVLSARSVGAKSK